MPGAIKKRTRSSKVVPAVSKRGASIISNFARVSKPQTPGKDLIDKTLPSQPAKVESISIDIVCSSKKRKAEIADENTNPLDDAPVQSPARSIKRRRQLGAIENNQQLPQTPSRNNDADLLGAQPLLERLQLQSSPASRTSIGKDQLPQQLDDLVKLNSSFTKALAIHHIHNGTNVPIDLQTLCPSITLSWGKRKVVLDDLRRCIGVQDARGPSVFTSPYQLIDYGRGKICIELRPQAAAIVNEAKVNCAFENNLKTLWSRRTGTSTAEVKRFFAGLPMAPVTISESFARASATLSKGQRTLEQLKHGIFIKKKEEADRKAQASAITHSDGAKMSLIDRIRYKEALQAQQSASPSPQELQRRAALHRAADIADVISMLSLGHLRVAYTMPELLTKLKDSLRVPISREEGASCIKLLATEVAPQWLNVVTRGGKENVVVLTRLAPTKASIRERIASISS